MWIRINISQALVAQTVKNPPATQETWVQSGSGRSPGKQNGNPFQYSCLENPMDRGVWGATVHVVTESQIQLSDYTFTFRTVFIWKRELMLREKKCLTSDQTHR